MGEFVRRLLKMPLRAAFRSERPIMLIGHSMGSIIAYDALWQLSQELGPDYKIDLFLTMGSPLGQTFIQRRVKGSREEPGNRYPRNIRNWVNIAAVGDLTAIDMGLKDDFEEMIRTGMVESFEDRQFYNHYRMNGELNPHSEYGYLLNQETAGCVAEWWRKVRPDRD
jgi:hypothetical protein